MQKASLVAFDKFFLNRLSTLKSVYGTILEMTSLWRFKLGQENKNWFPGPNWRDGR